MKVTESMCNICCNTSVQQQRADTLSDSNIESWISVYRLRDKVRCAQDVYTSLTNPKVSHLYSSIRFFLLIIRTTAGSSSTLQFLRRRRVH